jgi:hypothetical protein
MSGVSAIISLGQGLALPSVRSQLAGILFKWNWANLSDSTYQTFYTLAVAAVGVVIYLISRHFFIKYGCNLE